MSDGCKIQILYIFLRAIFYPQRHKHIYAKINKGLENYQIFCRFENILETFRKSPQQLVNKKKKKYGVSTP